MSDTAAPTEPTYDQLARKVENLEIVLLNDRRTGMAIGILIERFRITEAAAFEMLRLRSMATHQKVRDLADDLIATGELKDLPTLTDDAGQGVRR